MKNKESLTKVIQSINKGKKFPAIQLVKDNPELAAVVSKLVRPANTAEFDLDAKNSYYNLNQGQIQAISDTVRSNIDDNKNILQLFPDIELAIQILVSSVLSPKDMVKTELLYMSKDLVLPAELTLKLQSVISTHLEGFYDIKSILPIILRDTLFNTGSYVQAVIPESIVDELINNNRGIGTESLTEIFTNDKKIQSLGILGSPGVRTKRLATESSLFDVGVPATSYSGAILADDKKLTAALSGLIDVTDNYKLLKLPGVIATAAKNRISDIVRPRAATESFSKFSNTEMSNFLYKDNQHKSDQFVVMPGRQNAKRKSVSRPMVMKLPSESVIPVYIPGDESKHIGYFVLLDVDGNPVNSSSTPIAGGGTGLDKLTSSESGGNSSISSMLISKAKHNLASTGAAPTIDQITQVYGSIIEKDLVERLNNGLYGGNVVVGNDSEVYRIMLARTLAGSFTRLLFIPADLVTYFAFKHHENGVGKSYLDDIKVLTSLRAIILFSKVMALTKNSIAVTHVNMTLDPNDPDPQKTIEVASNEIVKMRQQYFPLGINAPVDLVDWIQRAGFEFSFEGHPGLPTTKFDFESKNMQHDVPDSELDELLRKQTYMAFGLSPEIVDNGFSSDFATTVISNNILLSKRIMQLQEIFTRDLTDMAKKIVLSDPKILDEMKAIARENKESLERTMTNEEREFYTEDTEGYLNDVLERVVDNLSVELPKPDITTIQNQTEAFDQYSDSLDKALDAWISSESISADIAGDVADNVDTIRNIVKNYYIRNWMSNNAFMPELSDITTADEDGKPVLDIYDISKDHIEGVVRTSLKLMKSLRPMKKAADTDIENLDVEVEEPVVDTGGEDDFDMGDDLDAEDAGDDTEEDVVDEEPEEPTE